MPALPWLLMLRDVVAQELRRVVGEPALLHQGVEEGLHGGMGVIRVLPPLAVNDNRKPDLLPAPPLSPSATPPDVLAPGLLVVPPDSPVGAKHLVRASGDSWDLPFSHGHSLKLVNWELKTGNEQRNQGTSGRPCRSFSIPSSRFSVRRFRFLFKTAPPPPRGDGPSCSPRRGQSSPRDRGGPCSFVSAPRHRSPFQGNRAG